MSCCYLFVKVSNNEQNDFQFHKRRDFFSALYSLALSNLTLHAPRALSKKDVPSTFSLVKKRKYMGIHLKKELTDLF